MYTVLTGLPLTVLLEALVFLPRACRPEIARVSAAGTHGFSPNFRRWDDSGTINTEELVLVSHNLRELQQLMSDYVGIVRSNLRLELGFPQERGCFMKEVGKLLWQKTRFSVPLCQLRNMIGIAYPGYSLCHET